MLENRPRAVRRWLRRPLYLAAAGVALAVVVLAWNRYDEQRVRDQISDGIETEATARWEREGGGEVLYYEYRHPSGQVLRACCGTYALDVVDGDRIEISVSRRNPTSAQIVGDHWEATDEWAVLLLPLPGLLWWGWRRWQIRRLRRAVLDHGPSMQMRAVPSPPGWWTNRWRLHLYPEGAPDGSRPACTVPLVARPEQLGPRSLTVIGTPAPRRWALAFDVAADEDLWPRARCLRGNGWGPGRFAAPEAPYRAWATHVLVGLALVVVALGSVADARVDTDVDIEDRGYPITGEVLVAKEDAYGATVARVHLRWLGEDRIAKVTTDDAVRIGEPLRLWIDPVQPRHVWADSDYVPGGWWPDLGYLVGFLLMLAAGVTWPIQRARSRRRHKVPAPPPRPPHPPAPPYPPPPPPWEMRATWS